MGLAPKQRRRLSTNNTLGSLCWCLSHFHDGPTELSTGKGDRRRDVAFSWNSKMNSTRIQSGLMTTHFEWNPFCNSWVTVSTHLSRLRERSSISELTLVPLTHERFPFE